MHQHVGYAEFGHRSCHLRVARAGDIVDDIHAEVLNTMAGYIGAEGVYAQGHIRVYRPQHTHPHIQATALFFGRGTFATRACRACAYVYDIDAFVQERAHTHRHRFLVKGSRVAVKRVVRNIEDAHHQRTVHGLNLTP